MPAVYSWEFAAKASRGAPSGASVVVPTGDNAARVATALTGVTVPFSYSTPADPVTTSQATVTPATLAANLVAGRELTLTAGTYNAVTWNVNNLDIICEAGVSFTGGMNFSADSIRLTGGGGTTVTGVIQFNAGTVDVLMDNITSENWYFGEDGTLRRIACINCTISYSGTNWGMIGGNGTEDLIFARCDIETTNSTYSSSRLVGLVRYIDANNRWSTGAQQNRRHCTETNGTFPLSYFFISANQYESNGSHSGAQLYVQSTNAPGDGDGVSMDNGWITNNSFYRNDTNNGHCDVGNNVTLDCSAITVTGNRAYCGSTPGTTMGFINGSMPSSTVSDNLTAAYTAPPTFPYGAT